MMSEVKVKVVGIEDGLFGKNVVIKMPRWRKARECSVLEVEDNKILIQGDKFIMLVDVESGDAVYNTKGEYFLYLNPALGAKKGKVSREFIDKVMSVMVREGDTIGIMPDGSKVVYGGGRLI